VIKRSHLTKQRLCWLDTNEATSIADHQTGVVTSLEELTVSRLAPLVDEVINNSMYRDNARKCRQAITKTNGLSRGAGLLEEAFGLTKEVS
jgi:UDP:flavonoid glycosyltransferase YjiC (YdhE family)